MPNSGSFSALVWPTWWRWKVRDRLGIRIYRIYWVGHVSFVFENWWCDPKISQVQPVEVSEAVDAKLLSFLKIETLHTWCAFQKWIGLLTRRQWAQPIETSSANLSPLCHMPGVPEVWVFAEDARTTPEFGKSCFTRRPVYILHVALQKKKQRMPHKLFCWCPKPRTSKNYNQTGERYLMSRKGMECERLFDHGFTNITNDWKYCTMSLQNHEVSSFLLPTSQAATTLI
jgi:hypothetical protein